MLDYDFAWTEENLTHLAEHGISSEDFEHVFYHAEFQGPSRSSGNPSMWGHTVDGRYIIIVYKKLTPVRILPITAYEVPQRFDKKRRGKKP